MARALRAKLFWIIGKSQLYGNCLSRLTVFEGTNRVCDLEDHPQWAALANPSTTLLPRIDPSIKTLSDHLQRTSTGDQELGRRTAMAKRRSQSRLWFLLVAFDDYGQTLPQSLPVQRPRATVQFLLSPFLPSCWIRFYTSLSLQRMRTSFL